MSNDRWKIAFVLFAVSLCLCVSHPTLSHTQTRSSLKDAFNDDFLIGAALNRRQIFEEDPRALAIIKAQFNTITPENVLKWGLVHPAPDKYDFAAPDRDVAFGENTTCSSLGIRCCGTSRLQLG